MGQGRLKPPRSLVLGLWLAVSARGARRADRLLTDRAARGKEDPERLDERRGVASAKRPDGRLIWFHAASVGESLSLLEVIRRLSGAAPDLGFLVTTGTVSSAGVLAARLPGRCIHQYVPLDVQPWVDRFLDHWQPDLAVWTESELWPALICGAFDRDIPMLLLNARMSEKSLKRWRWLGQAAPALLQRFAAVQAQDDITAAGLRKLGLPPDRLTVTGTLKEGTPPPPCDETERRRMAQVFDGRPVWTATSTHEGEEAIVSAAHRRAIGTSPRLLLVLAPRHPERGAQIASALRDAGHRVAVRSQDQDPDRDADILLADTLGELGLWYRLAPVCFLGGSLLPVGGHNPFEPAALGSAILHGPHVENFHDIFDRLDTAGGARQVTDGETLGRAVVDLLQPDQAAPLAFAAWEVCSSGANATDKALAAILDLLPGAP